MDFHSISHVRHSHDFMEAKLIKLLHLNTEFEICCLIGGLEVKLKNQNFNVLSLKLFYRSNC